MQVKQISEINQCAGPPTTNAFDILENIVMENAATAQMQIGDANEIQDTKYTCSSQ